MAQDLQLISDVLEKAPFNRKTSILDLDALNGQTALQFLNDIFASLDPTQTATVSDEDPRDTALRFFVFLRLLRYPAPVDPDDLSTWRQDVVEGKRRALVPILLWISKNLVMVQQRVYLAKYMVKIDVPPELRADSEINQICEEQDRLVAEFAAVHKASIQLQSDANLVNEYRQEIKDLRLQKDQIESRVSELLARVRNMPGRSADKEQRMALAHSIRNEREKYSQLVDKRAELMHLAPIQTERIGRLKDFIAKMTSDWLEMTPEKLLKKLEDRLVIQRRAVSEVLPKVVADEKTIVEELRRLVVIPDFTDKHLNELRIKAQMLQTEVFNMSDKLRTIGQDPEQTQMAAYRSQTETLNNRKRDLTARNDSIYREIRQLEKQLRAARGMDDDAGGDVSLTTKLLQSNEDYEKKQHTIKMMTTERSNAIRSNAVLAAENDRIGNILSQWEKRTGVNPLESAGRHNQAALLKTNDVMALAEQARTVERSTTTKRSQVQELLSEMQPIRQRHKALQETLEAEKLKLQHSSGGALGDLDKSITGLRKDIQDCEDQLGARQIELQYSEILLKRADDAKIDNKFLKSVSLEVKKETERLDQLTTKLSQAKVTSAKNSSQATPWRDLNQLFDLKIEQLQHDLELMEMKSRRFGSGRERIVMS